MERFAGYQKSIGAVTCHIWGSYNLAATANNAAGLKWPSIFGIVLNLVDLFVG